MQTMVNHRRSRRLLARKLHKSMAIDDVDTDFQEPMVKAIARFRRFQLTGKPPTRPIKKNTDENKSTYPACAQQKNHMTNIQEERLSKVSFVHTEQGLGSEKEKDNSSNNSSDSELQVPMTPSTVRFNEEEDEEDELDDSSSDDE